MISFCICWTNNQKNFSVELGLILLLNYIAFLLSLNVSWNWLQKENKSYGLTADGYHYYSAAKRTAIVFQKTFSPHCLTWYGLFFNMQHLSAVFILCLMCVQKHVHIRMLTLLARAFGFFNPKWNAWWFALHRWIC